MGAVDGGDPVGSAVPFAKVVDASVPLAVPLAVPLVVPLVVVGDGVAADKRRDDVGADVGDTALHRLFLLP